MTKSTAKCSMNVKKILVRNCVFAINPLTDTPLHRSTYQIENLDGQFLWHENLFLCHLTKVNSLNTIRSYASDLVQFSKMNLPLGGWRKVTNSIMRGYIKGAMFSTKNYSIQTLTRHVSTIKSFYDWLYKQGYTSARQAIDFDCKSLYPEETSNDQAYKLSQHTFNSRYIGNNEFEKILSGIKSKDSFIIERNEIALSLGFLTGTRASEVLSLEYPEVRKAIQEAKEKNSGTWATTVISIVGKGGAKRNLHIPPALCEKIFRYIKRHRCKLSTGGPLLCSSRGHPLKDKKFASNVFADACRGALIARTSHQGYHALRKSFGTHLVSNCYEHGRDPWVEVPRRLGHKNIETTLGYIHFEALLHNRSKVLSELNMRDRKFRG